MIWEDIDLEKLSEYKFADNHETLFDDYIPMNEW